MNEIFFIILLYVIFGVIGPLFKRMQRQQQQLPSKTPETPAKNQRMPQQSRETKLEKSFARLQEAFQQPPELPPVEQEAQSLFSEEKVPEFLPPPLPAQPRVSTTYRRPVIDRRKTTPATMASKKSLLGIDRRRGYIQGILMAEILGPPVSKRR